MTLGAGRLRARIWRGWFVSVTVTIIYVVVTVLLPCIVSWWFSVDLGSCLFYNGL